MKKVYFGVFLLVLMIMTASCKSPPKTPANDAPQETEQAPEIIEEDEDEEEPDDGDFFADIFEDEEFDEEEFDLDEFDMDELAEEEEFEDEEFDFEDEFDLAEADIEEEFFEEEIEPPPEIAFVPEPEPEPPPPPPPVVQAPPPAPAPPAPRPSPPSPPPPVPPPPAVEEEPPAVQEPPPPMPYVPELPNPTGSVSSWQDEKVIFSRMVRATVGQLVEIPFRGTGWVYLGEAAARRGILYDSRRLDPEGQSFIFKTESPGEYALKFYRQDFIRDFILNDYVQVIVGAPPETAGAGWFGPPIDRGRVIAEPRWPTSLAEAEAHRADSRPSESSLANRPSSAVSGGAASAPPPVQTPPSAAPPVSAAPPPAAPPPVQAPPSVVPPVTAAPAPAAPPVQTPPALPESPAALPQTEAPPVPLDLDPETYIEKAKEEFEAGRVASAIAFLDQFFDRYPVGSDEALWLLGQFYEANSPSRNILASLDCYRRLMEEYPQSSRYDDARRRIAYLQRYYININ